MPQKAAGGKAGQRSMEEEGKDGLVAVGGSGQGERRKRGQRGR